MIPALQQEPGVTGCFTVSAVGARTSWEPATTDLTSADRRTSDQAIKSHILAQGELMGTFGR